MNSYDFIIVGSGSAGAIVASRLSENPDAKILVLEAGGNEFPPNVHIPSLWYTQLGSNVDWCYETIPQPGLNGRIVREPRGKLPGGTSNLHIMMHVRGHSSDYDNWAYNGAIGWSYKECLPFFKKLEDQEDVTSEWTGKGGPMRIICPRDHNPHPTSVAFLNSCYEKGYPYTADFNGPTMEGAGWHHVYIKDGVRQSTWMAYLKPATEKNNKLVLSVNSMATRLLFDDKKCIGVEYIQNGEVKKAYADTEVVVSCGAIESPKLLMLSGIGNSQELSNHNIPVISDLPGVGENFHNHVLIGIIRASKKPMPPGNNNLSEAALYWKTDPRHIGPDMQFAFVHVPFDIIIGQNNPNSFSILPGVVRQKSKGWIKLKSNDPLEHPLINPNYLAEPYDVETMVTCLKMSREILSASAFSEWAGEELLPGPDFKTDDDLRRFCRLRADSYHHQAGSCKMGIDSMSVVSPDLKVYGVTNLRVADASVMPLVQSGNCNAGIMMVGERCADFIKKDYNL
jgi:choline dehydrogenase